MEADDRHVPTVHLVSLTSVPLQARAYLVSDWLSMVVWFDDIKPSRPGAGIMEADDRQMTTVFAVQPSFHYHSTIGTRQTEYHEALPSSVNDAVRCDCTFADDGNASRYWVFRVPMVE